MTRHLERFLAFLRIRSVQPSPDYAGVSAFLKSEAAALGLVFAEHNPASHGYKPVIVLSWPSTASKEKKKSTAVMFNTHTDVVPVDASKWTLLKDPFDAQVINGEIVARGSQDMKCVGAALLAAVDELKRAGWDNPSPRDIHLAFTPEEEIGGLEGWNLFTDTAEFKALDVAFYVDEGIANPDTTGIEVFYSERVGASCRATAYGSAGHGSQFLPSTAGAKLMAFAAELLALRDDQEKVLAEGKLPDGTPFALGDVTTVNLTMLGGGSQVNVVPAELSATFDIRVTPHTLHSEFRGRLESIAAKHSVSLTFLRDPVTPPLIPVTDPLYSRWWAVFAKLAAERGLEPRPRIFPAASDARYLRRAGVPALGCSYLVGCPVLLHDHDERIPVEVFEKGIEWYKDLIQGLSAVDGE